MATKGVFKTLKAVILGLLPQDVKGSQLAWDDSGLLSPAFTFFDPNDPACQEILFDPKTTIPELFAIVRQWVPQVQHKIDVIGNEVGAFWKTGDGGAAVPPSLGNPMLSSGAPRFCVVAAT